jgi:hypothetical protein
LDGSPPAYHLDKGFGTGINSWLVQFEVCLVLQIAINNRVLNFFGKFMEDSLLLAMNFNFDFVREEDGAIMSLLALVERRID